MEGSIHNDQIEEEEEDLSHCKTQNLIKLKKAEKELRA